MSTVRYTYKPSQLHLVKCEWSLDDELHQYTFKYTGDVIDACIACTNSVVWSNHPSFKITKIISRDI